MSEQDSLKDTNRILPTAKMREMTNYCWISRAIYVAAKLGIADLLKDGPKSSDEIARFVGVHPRALYRVLRALTSRGIFAETEDGIFELTPLAETLQTGVAGSIRAWTILTGEEFHWKPWGEILYSVRTGKPAFNHVFGMGPFEYLSRHPEADAVFNEAMTNLTGLEASAVIEACDFSGMEQIIDVGGGNGSLITAILKMHSQAHGILFDVPNVTENARRLIEAEGIADRCRIVSGDMFESVPEGGDAYILKHIIHTCDDDRAVTILENCRRAMLSNGRLLIAEKVIPPRNEPFEGIFGDILMLVMADGHMRTEVELRALFDASGLKLTRIISPDSPMNVVEGVPV